MTIIEMTLLRFLVHLFHDSQFRDIFDVDYFINSLRDEVHILKELPPQMKQKIETKFLFSMPPVSWSNMTYYYDVVCTPHTPVTRVTRTECSHQKSPNNK